jgi:hypothetical protein
MKNKIKMDKIMSKLTAIILMLMIYKDLRSFKNQNFGGGI